MSTTPATLLPCPLATSEADYRHTIRLVGHSIVLHGVECACGIELKGNAASEAEAVTRWNNLPRKPYRGSGFFWCNGCAKGLPFQNCPTHGKGEEILRASAGAEWPEEVLKRLLKWALTEIEDNLDKNGDGTPDHACGYINAPDTGYCKFHDNYWCAKEAIGEAGTEEAARGRMGINVEQDDL